MNPQNSQTPIKPKDPLHGITLQAILEHLESQYSWAELANMVNIKCFSINPSIKSSLTFLRKTPWARAKVESLYLWSLREIKRAQGLRVEVE